MDSTRISFDIGANYRTRCLDKPDSTRKIDEKKRDDFGKVMPCNSSMLEKYCLEPDCEMGLADRGFKAGLSSPNLSGAQLSEVFICIKINRAFPKAAQIQKEITRLGYYWRDDDWVEPDVMTRWVVKIGVDVAVEVAQTVLSVCLKHTHKISEVAIMYYEEEPQYRRSIFIGSEGSRQLQPRSQLELMRLLEPRITKMRFHKLAAGLKD